MLRAHATVALAGVLGIVLPSAARADEKQACIAASEDAQQLRLDGKLLSSRARLLECARPECPAIVRQDCTQWMSDVVAAIPTVVLGARDPQGRDVFDVRASVDGVPVAGRLDGRPMAIDPGVHRFRLESTTARPAAAEAQVLVRAGEKNREITVTLAEPTAIATLPEKHQAGASARPGVPALAWAFGGVAVAALGTALAFDVAQALDYDHLASTCAGHCPPDQVDRIATERFVAGIAAGVGAVSLGTAAYFFFAHRGGTTASPAPAVRVGFVAVPRGGVGGVVGRF